MSVRYREFAPPERLRPYVECFWSVEAGESIPDYPVLPDGCVDIVYTPESGLEIVGTMTRVHKFALEAGNEQVGVRFRPGMGTGFIDVPGKQTTDQLLPLADAWGARCGELARKMNDAKSGPHRIALLEAQLTDDSRPGVVQQISAYIVAQSGQVRVDDLAFDAGMSARQLRRLFVEQLGLTPKHLCRVIRFQHSLALMRGSRRGDWTQVALDSGYYDQAHFINEFREFSGLTPGEFAARPR